MAEDLARIVAADLPWHELEGRTVLVSGANGFLPAYLVESLLYRNESSGAAPTSVIALVRNAARAEQRFARYLGRDDLTLLVQDVTEPARITGPVHVIVHAASQASPKYYSTDPVGTLSANVLGTHHLLSLARAKRSERFLYFSSGEVYGEVGASQVPTRETDYGYLDPTAVRSCYAESKRLGETMCVAWAHQFGVPASIVRPFHTYGPGMALDDGRVFADFVADVVARRDITMKSDGLATRAFCYLADATAGFLTVLLKGTVGEAYNVGNDGAELAIRELAEILAGLFPELGLRVIHQRDVDKAAGGGYLKSTITRNCPDTTRVRALGWAPTTSVADGFRRTIQSFS
ncbi:MAG: dTDP-glucose 46-dehydratase [Gemmatimonadetes bacterium]|jgi:UDP-glucuronate decarboxylase|nr:dTDP-glucose 46-dehydratase [Gemmatimonadota bacterium]